MGFHRWARSGDLCPRHDPPDLVGTPSQPLCDLVDSQTLIPHPKDHTFHGAEKTPVDLHLENPNRFPETPFKTLDGNPRHRVRHLRER